MLDRKDCENCVWALDVNDDMDVWCHYHKCIVHNTCNKFDDINTEKEEGSG